MIRCFLLTSQRRYLRSTGWLNYIGYSREEIVKTDDIANNVKTVKALDLKIAELLTN